MKTIAVDFDGVISQYSGYEGRGGYGAPVTGVKEALQKLEDAGWTIIVYTCRDENFDIKGFLEEHKIPYKYLNYNPQNSVLGLSRKIVADVYLDDKAIQFKGDWEYALTQIKRFKPYWRE